MWRKKGAKRKLLLGAQRNGAGATRAGQSVQQQALRPPSPAPSCAARESQRRGPGWEHPYLAAWPGQLEWLPLASSVCGASIRALRAPAGRRGRQPVIGKLPQGAAAAQAPSKTQAGRHARLPLQPTLCCLAGHHHPAHPTLKLCCTAQPTSCFSSSSFFSSAFSSSFFSASAGATGRHAAAAVGRWRRRGTGGTRANR